MKGNSVCLSGYRAEPRDEPPRMKIAYERLTASQRRILETIRETSRLVIFGCAGSGKTALAIDTIERLAAEGKDVLVLCSNGMLANRLRSDLIVPPSAAVPGKSTQFSKILIPTGEVYVADFCAFLRYLVRSHGSPGMMLPRLKWVNSQPWAEFDNPTEIDLNLALDYLFQFPSRFDAVVVDQGEDFLGDWWPVVEACLTDRQNGTLYVFADNNTAVYDFQPNFRYDIYETPIQLTTNCRSSPQIVERIRKLHANPNEIETLTTREGFVREWIYSTPDQLYAAMKEAIIATEGVINLLQELVVIALENRPPKESALRGMVFDSPRMLAARQPGRISWQDAVCFYLKPFGFVESELSGHPLPGGEDLHRIGTFCSAYQRRHTGELKLQTSQLGRKKLLWRMDYYGELRLHWETGEDNRPSERDLVDFFRSANWTASLPKAHRRFRLTTPDNIPKFPDYQTIPLVDVGYFKGLETNAAIFVLHDYISQYEWMLHQKLYEALSRPKNLLNIVSPYSLLNP